MFKKSSPDEAPTETTNASNMIGKETTIEGNLNTAGNLRVEGKIVGNVTTKAKVVLGSSAKVDGQIIAQFAEIGGHVQGTLKVAELLVLRPTAIIEGDIITQKLVFEAGAQFNGQCKMGPEAKSATLSTSNNSFMNNAEKSGTQKNLTKIA